MELNEIVAVLPTQQSEVKSTCNVNNKRPCSLAKRETQKGAEHDRGGWILRRICSFMYQKGGGGEGMSPPSPSLRQWTCFIYVCMVEIVCKAGFWILLHIQTGSIPWLLLYILITKIGGAFLQRSNCKLSFLWLLPNCIKSIKLGATKWTITWRSWGDGYLGRIQFASFEWGNITGLCSSFHQDNSSWALVRKKKRELYWHIQLRNFVVIPICTQKQTSQVDIKVVKKICILCIYRNLPVLLILLHHK